MLSMAFSSNFSSARSQRSDNSSEYYCVFPIAYVIRISVSAVMNIGKVASGSLSLV
jgi:hypothetical protein